MGNMSMPFMTQGQKPDTTVRELTGPRPPGRMGNKKSFVKKETMKTVNELMREACERPRDSRSQEYKEGVRAMLEARVNSVPLRYLYMTGGTERAFPKDQVQYPSTRSRRQRVLRPPEVARRDVLIPE